LLLGGRVMLLRMGGRRGLFCDFYKKIMLPSITFARDEGAHSILAWEIYCKDQSFNLFSLNGYIHAQSFFLELSMRIQRVHDLRRV
jgi:hypothetical protein